MLPDKIVPSLARKRAYWAFDFVAVEVPVGSIVVKRMVERAFFIRGALYVRPFQVYQCSVFFSIYYLVRTVVVLPIYTEHISFDVCFGFNSKPQYYIFTSGYYNCDSICLNYFVCRMIRTCSKQSMSCPYSPIHVGRKLDFWLFNTILNSRINKAFRIKYPIRFTLLLNHSCRLLFVCILCFSARYGAYRTTHENSMRSTSHDHTTPIRYCANHWCTPLTSIQSHASRPLKANMICVVITTTCSTASKTFYDFISSILYISLTPYKHFQITSYILFVHFTPYTLTILYDIRYLCLKQIQKEEVSIATGPDECRVSDRENVETVVERSGRQLLA